MIANPEAAQGVLMAKTKEQAITEFTGWIT
jgi:hypothetical protein